MRNSIVAHAARRVDSGRTTGSQSIGCSNAANLLP
jgi:hypothetical protein